MEWKSCRRPLMMQRIMLRLTDITNAEFYVGKAEEVLPEYYREYAGEHNGGETAHADVIVVDPPRKGCEESLLQTIVDMQPETCCVC